LEEVHLLQQRTSKRKVLPLFVSTEKPLIPLILSMDLGFEEMLNWDQLEPTRKPKLG